MGDDAALELERRIGRVVGVGLVWLAVLVDALGNVGRAEAAHRLHRAEEIVEHVAPVAEHVENDAAAFGLAIVPARPLRRLAPVAFEHPVAELAAHREDAAEEAGVAQHPELAQAGQEQLVLHDAVLDAARVGELGHGDGLVERVGDRLLAIDVLAGLDRLVSRSARICVVAASKNTLSVGFASAASRSVVSARCRTAAPAPRPSRHCGRPGSDPA